MIKWVVFNYSEKNKIFGTANSSTVRKSPNSVNVDCVNLQSIIETNNIERCDLLKIDTEGAEYDILYSTEKHVFDKIFNISIEYHNDNKNNGDQLASYLDKLGYTVFRKSIKRNSVN